MSKAFTRESDDIPDQPVPRVPHTLPPAGKNYLTPSGEQRLRAELDRLQRDRSEFLEAPAGSELRRQLQTLDLRIRYLRASLLSAIVVPSPSMPWDRVRFGATVTVRDNWGTEEHYRIVGIDEADPDRNWMSFRSPLAKALLNAKIGQRLRFPTPAGEEELQILGINYE